MATRALAGACCCSDGGTGSELRRRGYALDPLAWSAPAALTDFELLRSIQSDYIAAGADVISTNTFAATRFVLEAAGLGDRRVEVVERAVAAAREARATSGRDVVIAGSMSCLPPRGDPRAYPDARSESAAYGGLADGSPARVSISSHSRCSRTRSTRHARARRRATRAYRFGSA